MVMNVVRLLVVNLVRIRVRVVRLLAVKVVRVREVVRARERVVRLLVVKVVRVMVMRLLVVKVVRVLRVRVIRRGLGKWGKTSGNGKETILDETESESSREQFEAEVFEEVNGEGLNDSVGREEDGNETEYFDSDDHGSILGSEDDDNTDVYRRRSSFRTYNPNSASPHFCIGMLFKDGEQFKFAI
ncbi:hypothetical protein Gogos_003466, partial [Gossypium gossypioides]|nr:hypothetical protein [Gossypium gossypioides]